MSLTAEHHPELFVYYSSFIYITC